MSQITMRRVMIGLLLIGLAMLFGCGTPNPDAPFDADTQQHAADWMPHNHTVAAQNSLASCKECHGTNLDGGISGVNCTQCHIGGETSAHPADWEGTALTKHGPYVVANGSDSCKNRFCHGNTLRGFADHPACNACHSFPGLPDPQ